jgi:hypothetical protein
MDAIKVDNSNISVEKITPEKREMVVYNYDFLLKQREAIQAQKDRDNALRDAELAEVNMLIQKAEELGIKPAPVKDLVGE